MKLQKIKGSTLVLVLIILFVAAILMLFTMSAVVYQTKVIKTQQQKSTADLLAESALNVLTSEFLKNPEAFINNGETERSLIDMGICNPNATEIHKKCNSDSKVLISKLNYILAYRLKHGETIQVDLADKNSTPNISAINIIFSNPNYDTSTDRLLITAYYYTNPGSPNSTLKPYDTCFIAYKDAVESTSCAGDGDYIVIETGLSIPSNKSYFGNNRVRIRFTGNTKPHFIRIKGIYSSASKETWVSVTNDGYGDLPLPQEVILKTLVYSYDASGEVVQSKIARTLFVHPEMPEVMDWVFYNGSDSSVLK